MTEHDHTPPIIRDGAQWLTDNQLKITIDGHVFVRTWDESMRLAKSIVEALQLERP